MRTEPNLHLKTLGSQAAHLLTTLHECGLLIFTLADVARITRLKAVSARSFVRKLVNRGVATRLRSGLFTLVPFELGREREYMGNPYIVARALAASDPYYISHASAMDIHGMLTQPQFVVYATSPRPIRSRTVLGTEFRFVHCKQTHFFGTTHHWVDKREMVITSDLERTILDGLRRPDYCGGFTEVAKGFWMRQADINVRKLVDYALRLDVGAVIRRLGFLLETYGVQAQAQIKRLHRRLTATYLLLDPLLPPEGRYLARWRLRLNVSREEVQAVVGT